MADEKLKDLIQKIRIEFLKLKNFIRKRYAQRKSSDIEKLDNLFKGLKAWVKNPKGDPFLHPAKIIDFTANPSESQLTKRDINAIAQAILRLRESIEGPESYYKTSEGMNSDVKFVIQSYQRGGRYRLKALINDQDFVTIVRELKKPIIFPASFRQKANQEPINDLLLSPIEEVLQISPKDPENAKPMFFRKNGPFAADIEGGTIFIHSQVSEITKALKQENIVVLRGEAASGKTVIARVVAYQWLKTGKVRFVQLKTRSVNSYELSIEIERFGKEETAPLLVIEDAHIKLSDMNDILSTRSKNWPRILFTTRKVKPNLHREAIDNFKYLHEISLDKEYPRTDISKMYLEAKGCSITQDLAEDILDVSGENLWLQAYALQSLKEIDGKKYISRELILKEVEKDLGDLTYIEKEDLSREVKYLLPRILITLSILYRYEIPTDIRFIYQKFSYNNSQIKIALDELVMMGEALTIQENTNLYGLPHSTLAELYFELSEEPSWIEDTVYGDEGSFLCDYALSDRTVNGLVLFKHYFMEKHEIVSRLDKERIAHRMIARKDNSSEIADCIEWTSKIDRTAASQIIKSIAEDNLFTIISEMESIYDVERCISSIKQIDDEIDNKIYSTINMDGLVTNLYKGNYLSEDGESLSLLLHDAPELTNNLVKKLLIKPGLAKSISTGKDLCSIASWISVLSSVIPEDSQEFLNSIDRQQLGDHVSNEKEILCVNDFLCRLGKFDSKFAKDFLRYLSKQKFANNISQSREFGDIGRCISTLAELDPDFIRELIPFLNKEDLVGNMHDLKDLFGFSSCIDSLYELDRSFSNELLQMITNKDQLDLSINTMSDLFYFIMFADSLSKSDPTLTKALVKLIDEDGLANSMCEADDIIDLKNWFYYLRTGNPEIKIRVLNVVDKRKLAGFFSGSSDFLSLHLCITELSKLSDVFAKKVVPFICKEKLAVKMSNSFMFDDMSKCIDLLFKLKPQFIRDIVSILKKEEVSINILDGEGIQGIGPFVDSLYNVDPTFGKELVEMLNKKEIARKIIETKWVLLYDLARCVKSVFAADDESGKELAFHLNNQRITSNVSKKNYLEYIKRILKMIYRVFPDLDENFFKVMYKELIKYVQE